MSKCVWTGTKAAYPVDVIGSQAKKKNTNEQTNKQQKQQNNIGQSKTSIL